MNKLTCFNQTISLPSFIVSDFEALLQKELSEDVYLYPSLNDLQEISFKEFDKLIVLGTKQIEEQFFLKRKIPLAQLHTSSNDILSFLGTDIEEEDCESLAKQQQVYKALYVFLKLYKKYNWNPSWIQSIFKERKNYWILFTFMDADELAKAFISVQSYISKTQKPSPYILIQLLYSEITKERTLAYEFFTKFKTKKKTFSEEELEEFDIEKLTREVIIYSPREGEYKVVE